MWRGCGSASSAAALVARSPVARAEHRPGCGCATQPTERGVRCLWTLSAIAAPTTGAGVGEAVLDNGMAVGRKGSAGFSSPGTGTGSVLPPATGFSDAAHKYDVALVAGNLIAVGYGGT